jgi:hypothetical protein
MRSRQTRKPGTRSCRGKDGDQARKQLAQWAGKSYLSESAASVRDDSLGSDPERKAAARQSRNRGPGERPGQLFVQVRVCSRLYFPSNPPRNAIAGDWNVTYGAPARVAMTLAGGVYTETASMPQVFWTVTQDVDCVVSGPPEQQIRCALRQGAVLADVGVHRLGRVGRAGARIVRSKASSPGEGSARRWRARRGRDPGLPGGRSRGRRPLPRWTRRGSRRRT